MGLSFVTEGSIPFAAADPIRAIPSFIIGSALTGGLVGAFGIKLLAPHGGIWVMLIPNVINHLPMYLLAIGAGTVVTALSLGLLKKSSEEQVGNEEKIVKQEKIINEVEV